MSPTNRAPAPEASDRHPVDEVLPASQLFFFGLQHMLIMYAGCVAVPLVLGAVLGLDTHTIAMIVNADLLVAGIATIIQSVGLTRFFGIRLPVVAGASFTFLTPMMLIGSEYGMPTMYGSMIAAGVFGIVLARPFSKVLRFFPTLVTGCVITIIGLSLIGVAANLITGDDPKDKDYAGVGHILLAFGVILVIVLVNRLFTGFVRNIAVLVGLAAGAVAAWAMGMADFSSVGAAKWIGLSTPLHFGAPEFRVVPIIAMCVAMIVVFSEMTACVLAIGDAVGKKVTDKDMARGLATDGLAALLAGFMNSVPDSTFGQNVGLISLTKVKSRWVITVTGVLLVAMGAIPKLGELAASLPGPAIGGAGLVMFAMTAAVGIQMLQKVDYEGNNNLLIVAVSLGLGMLPVAVPAIYQNFHRDAQFIMGSAITATVLVAFLLNLLFNHLLVREGTPAPAGPEDGADTRGGDGADAAAGTGAGDGTGVPVLHKDSTAVPEAPAAS
ncbi:MULTISPECIES: nucleobase:cation symporter-2 family protein [unclassified Streptomyces]|uniref:nucleobase:cation symporter-2 family protein n=1 Tax=unclassified Streptomyces TaxID=2593676 RepID=UPI0022384727|nr:nucleobase:cation symporter-2 family protein [Streptomyces sp. SHP 1-2]